MNLNVPLTKPVLCRTEVSPLIEDNIKDDHDANHGVERCQGSHGGKSAFTVVNNHEDEKDENSGDKIHQHFKHQDNLIQRVQSLIFVVVAKIK